METESTVKARVLIVDDQTQMRALILGAGGKYTVRQYRVKEALHA